MSLRAVMPPFAQEVIEADEIEGDVLEHGKVMSGMADTGAHLIVGKSGIQTPMQTVLDNPVRPYCPGQEQGIGRQTAEV